MRKIILSLGISIDGYIARRDGAVDFLFMPKDYSMSEFFKSVDAAILGRKTYEAGLKMSGGKIDWFGIPSYIMSRSLPAGERDGATVVHDSPSELVGKLREKSGKDIWHMGGGELASSFLADDLVDEMHLGIVPVALGEGLPLFPSGFPQRDFELIDSRTYSRGLVVLKYHRAR